MLLTVPEYGCASCALLRDKRRLGYKIQSVNSVCSQIHTEHINILCGKNVEFVFLKYGGIHSDH